MNGTKALLGELAGGGAGDAYEFLRRVIVTDWHEEPPAERQLLAQFVRHVGTSGRHDDGVIGSVLG